MDSRVTQWLDFYTGPSELKAQRPALPPPPITAQPPSRDQRPGSRVDLQPAPLRVPSSERRASPGASPTTPARQNSTSKPLPHLPAQAEVLVHPHPDKSSVVSKAKAESLDREREPATCHQKLSSEELDRELLPPLCLITPPTPSTSGAAGDISPPQDKDGCEDEDKPLPPEPEQSDEISREQPSGPKTVSGGPIAFTRKERIWLHVNYRGEGPFLRAWGLDITKPVDRSEGLALLRDLILAEGDGKGVGTSRPLVKC